MAFLLVKIIAEGQGHLDDKWHRNYTQTWIVVTDNATIDETRVMFAPGMPAVHISPFTDALGVVRDGQAICTSVSPRRVDRDDPFLWHVDVEFSTRSSDPNKESSNQNDHPTAKPPGRSWGNTKIRKPLDPDMDGKPLRNSAGQPYENVPEYEVALLTLTILRNENSFNSDQAELYLYNVNQDVFYGYQPGQALLTGYTGDEDYEKGYRYWKVKYEILFDEDGHQVSLRDCGTLEQNGAYELVPVDAAGVPHAGVVNLDGNGARLAAGQPTVYNTFRRYPKRNFATLNLEF